MSAIARTTATATATGRQAKPDQAVQTWLRPCVAEGIGSFFLVLGGVGTAVLAGGFMGALGVALAFGLTLVVLVYVIGPVSGCHVNPAVTVGLCVARKIAPKLAGAYIVAQCLGAILAAATVWLIADSGPFGYSAGAQGLGANGYGTHSPIGFGLGGAFLAELVLTGLLVFTVLGATHIQAPPGFAGIAIGFVLAVGNLVAIPVDNASINPARSLGPAVFAGGWALSQLWLFIVAPIVGALLAAAVHLALRAGPQVRASTAFRALPEESALRLAQEAARLEGVRLSLEDLLRMPVGAPSRPDGRREPAGSTARSNGASPDPYPDDQPRSDARQPRADRAGTDRASMDRASTDRAGGR
ncbi:aquaporin [Pseudofrankia asymbiotica]|uniref:aquaporin n=1 Tax=Pseudofrankia asymbiotica TaxID=1834516 RepID=UPI000976465A|nr:aquaporin [Pseudofrankia asymbiotica]